MVIFTMTRLIITMRYPLNTFIKPLAIQIPNTLAGITKSI